ncbi:MAG: C-terminal binding protein [Planctomycetota bacterium]
MQHRAIYTDYPWADPDVERDILAAVGCELVSSPGKTEDVLCEHVADVDAIMTCWAPITARVIDAAKRCRHVARTGIGLDNIDVPHATSRGVLVTNVPDYCTEEVAEHALAMMFALGRKIAACHLATKQGRYDLVAALPIDLLGGKTVGVVGLGQTGAALAAKCGALGMRVMGTNRSGQAPRGVEWAPLDRLLEASDYVSLNLPLTGATRHLIGREQLRRMKPTAFLVNTARGGLIDHDALAEALDGGRLAGAALDVQETEPPDLAAAPMNDPRVIVTPHTAFCSPRAILELRQRVARQTADFLQGRTPENVINPQVLPARA